MIGGIIVKLAFIASLISFLSYVQYARRGVSNVLFLARATYLAAFVFVLSASAVLLYLILTHQFQYTYVWSYSSRDLPTPLLISTFYAGQEGSFMLWTLFTAIIGVMLLRDSARHDYEPQVMGVFSAIQLALLLMLLVKSPFLYVWETWTGEVQPGFMPADGRGLNPLLQNYWMVIHPQVLFAGFAATGVPYAYAMGALLKRDYDRWFKVATPWLVFGAFVLGTGIMLGGFWAYETLGWGGYWAWDPVENSSLVPWIVSIAAIHTILSQRKTGAFVRTNVVLGLLPFLLVLYSTFLTRSGVLGDTSVHSFVDPGMSVYLLLIGMIVVFAGLPVVMLVRRWKEMPRRVVTHTYYSREFALFLGATSLVFAAIFVVIGTSSPIITDVLQGKKSAVDISYYSTTIVPLAIAIAALTGLGQLLWWTRSDKRDLVGALTLPIFLASAVTIALVLLGVREHGHVVFLFASAFALFANLQVGWRIAKGNPKYAGGAVAHLGLAVMFFGFLASSEYGRKATVTLPAGTTVSAVGSHITYLGYRDLPNEKYAFDVRVERDGKTYTLSPVMYQSKYNEGLMRHPDILNLVSSDFYLAPLALETPDTASSTVTGSHQKQQKEMLIAEVSTKPFINLVWSGVIILLVGFLVTVVRRIQEGD